MINQINILLKTKNNFFIIVYMSKSFDNKTKSILYLLKEVDLHYYVYLINHLHHDIENDKIIIPFKEGIDVYIFKNYKLVSHIYCCKKLVIKYVYNYVDDKLSSMSKLYDPDSIITYFFSYESEKITVIRFYQEKNNMIPHNTKTIHWTYRYDNNKVVGYENTCDSLKFKNEKLIHDVWEDVNLEIFYEYDNDNVIEVTCKKENSIISERKCSYNNFNDVKSCTNIFKNSNNITKYIYKYKNNKIIIDVYCDNINYKYKYNVKDNVIEIKYYDDNNLYCNNVINY